MGSIQASFWEPFGILVLKVTRLHRFFGIPFPIRGNERPVCPPGGGGHVIRPRRRMFCEGRPVQEMTHFGSILAPFGLHLGSLWDTFSARGIVETIFLCPREGVGYNAAPVGYNTAPVGVKAERHLG